MCRGRGVKEAHLHDVVVVEAGVVGRCVAGGVGRRVAAGGRGFAVVSRGLQVDHKGAAHVFTQDLA